MRKRASILEVERLTVRFGGTVAVDDLSLSVAEREIAALVGPSGCGKTSLLRAVAGFERPQAGTVRIDGETVSGGARWTPPERRRVGMVFQEGALFPHLTVAGNVRYGVDDRPDGDRRAAALLDLVGMAAEADRYPDQLSGGQQQRVALARALAPTPRIVLLDEPFANLDAGLRARLRTEVRAILRAARATAVIVTHDQEEALSLADRVAVMAHGELLQVDPPETVYHRPVSVEVAELIGAGQLLDCNAAGGLLDSVFGPLRTDAPDGPCRLLVRPEDLTILPAAANDGADGELTGSSFFGHDEMLVVRLSAGRSVKVRQRSSTTRQTGSRLRTALSPRRYRVFVDGEGSFEASKD
jgi:iron(III) transport system ATP-binding protein